MMNPELLPAALTKLSGELIEDSKRPANYGGPYCIALLIKAEIVDKPFALFVVPDASHNCGMSVII